MFYGESSVSLNADGSFPVPLIFTIVNKKEVVMCKGIDGCIDLYLYDEWENFLENLGILPSGKEENRRYVRFFTSSAVEIKCTGSSIYIPEELSHHAGLEREALFIGALKKIEIWSPPRWKEYAENTSENIEYVAQNLSNIL